MNFISTRTLSIPLDKTDLLYPNRVYIFHFTPKEPIKDISGTVAKLKAIKDKRFDIVDAQVLTNDVQLQVKPRVQFLPIAIIGLLPLIGVAIAAVVAFIVLKGIPSYMYALILLGIGMVFILPKIIPKAGTYTKPF